ncbi:DUF2599 domain-containing protein [Spirillospora sp. CA-253888]
MKKLLSVALAAVAIVASFQAPAAADKWYCDRNWVGGAIQAKYIELGEERGPLGCPITNELSTPDGRGRFNHFNGGSIYWTAETGAHAVWGSIRDRWQSLGWEKGFLGYPLQDEQVNPDRDGRRQQFQGGTLYWHPTIGAYPVKGAIGQLWGQYGHETGRLGYPRSDERNGTHIGGPNQGNTGVIQTYSHGLDMLWSPGASIESTYYVCIDGPCAGYRGYPNKEWVNKTEVFHDLDDQRRSIHVYPTEAGFEDGRTDFNKLWTQVWGDHIPYPNMTQEQVDSVGQQLYCHAMWALEYWPGKYTGGKSWDLELWRPKVAWDEVTNPVKAKRHECNW